MKFWKKIEDMIKSMESYLLGYLLGVGLVMLQMYSFWGGLITMIVVALLLYLRVERQFKEKKQ